MERLQRFLAKFAMDVLRTALASAVGAFLFTHAWTQASAPPAQSVTPTPEQATTTSTAEATQIIRDEHDVMVQYLKAEHEKERAEVEKEVRESNAAKMAHDRVASVQQADLEPTKTVPPRTNPASRAVSTGGVYGATNSSATSGPTSAAAGPVTGASSPVAVASGSPTTIVTAGLPPPPVIQALPDAVTAKQIDTQRDPSRDQSRAPSLGEQAAAATHINDVVAFVHDVAGWFRHEDAPVPPAEVHTNPFTDVAM